MAERRFYEKRYAVREGHWSDLSNRDVPQNEVDDFFAYVLPPCEPINAFGEPSYLMGYIRDNDLHPFLEDRENLLQEADRFWQKQLAYEYLLYPTLLERPYPIWKGVEKDLKRRRKERALQYISYPVPFVIKESPDFRSDAKWYRYGQYIMNLYHGLAKGGYLSQEECARQIATRLEAEFGVDTFSFSAKQLQRVIKAHKEGKFGPIRTATCT